MNRTVQNLRRLFRVVTGSLFWIALILCVMAVILSVFHQGQGKLPGGWRVSIVMSDSMSPEFTAGSLVFVKTTEPAQIKKGDIISYRRGEESVTHRVIEVQSDNGSYAFATKGDANQTPDTNPVYGDDVYGVVSFSVLHLGWVLLWMRNPFALGAVLLGLLALLLLRRALRLPETPESRPYAS